MRTSMKPPPPMLPAAGSTTARAKATAAAASTALPPFFRISTPASEASGSSQTTIACAPRTAAGGHAGFETSPAAENSRGCCAGFWDCAERLMEKAKREMARRTRCDFLPMARLNLFLRARSVKGTEGAEKQGKREAKEAKEAEGA